MNAHRPNFYRRVRLFCELRVGDVASATGVSALRVGQIETGKRIPNITEARLIESYLRDRLRVVFATDGAVPGWLSDAEQMLTERAL
jgi:DNA-binding XRE family transcriptional regulator